MAYGCVPVILHLTTKLIQYPLILCMDCEMASRLRYCTETFHNDPITCLIWLTSECLESCYTFVYKERYSHMVLRVHHTRIEAEICNTHLLSLGNLFFNCPDCVYLICERHVNKCSDTSCHSCFRPCSEGLML